MWLLNDAERQRVHRFVKQIDRDRYIVGRSTLRRLLAQYLEVPADEVSIELDRFGRPYLSFPPSDVLDFNISHSGSCVLVALAFGMRVGVDVEAIRGGIDLLSVMRLVFTPLERKEVLNLNGQGREAAFFWYWTRKEALAKGIGSGLGAPLEKLDVRHDFLQRWEIRSLPVGERFQAAIAAEAHGWRLYCWNV
jgi:4'-phosphopantetheinyl transferase